MGIDLYTLKKRAVMVLTQSGKRQKVYFLQITVENALARDSQPMVDSAVKNSYREWEECNKLPGYVVLVGSDGLPRSGSPIFKWPFLKRSYCFDHELPGPFGYLGDREIWGYRIRTVREQAGLNIMETARRIDEGSTEVYKDFWQGVVFKSGEEFLRFHGRSAQSREGNGKSGKSGYDVISPRVSKILDLIRIIKEKGQGASQADLHFLGSLKEKAIQLGHTC